MSKLRKLIMQMTSFFGEVAAELRKSSWPTRSELLDSTLVVILSVIALAVFVGISDLVLMKFLELIL
ncbi:MAG: preprotein translocase subunit SecE [Kiritimatiellia bacterium]|jgi:preprotein translocase subunit SecE